MPVVLIVVVIVILGTVGVLLQPAPPRQQPPPRRHDPRHSSAAGPPVAVASAKAFDPAPGDGVEHDGDLHNLFDGNPQTTWETQSYASARFGGLKDGVGFALVLGSPHKVSQLKLTSPYERVEARAGVRRRQPEGEPRRLGPAGGLGAGVRATSRST